jgi:Family of unknown function (DUF5719)
VTAPRHASGGAGKSSAALTAEPEARARRRLAVLGSVIAVAVAGGLAGGLAGGTTPATTLQPAALVAVAAPPGSQSSSWYCAGGSGSSGPLARSLVLLVNAGGRPVPATVVVVTTKGATKETTETVPARGQLAVAPASVANGPWLGTRVDVGGGAVSATEMVDGSAGSAVASCASETAPKWYFAAGATTAGSSLRMSVFNPTADLAVVDLSFMTAAGVTAPQPFQGLVLEPGVFRSVTVGQYVQDQKQVAAVVTARSGSVVATELQTVHAGGVSGVALRLGAPAPADTWVLPRAEDVSGGTSEVSVFNPSNHIETVSIRPRLSSGSISPFTDKLGPDSVWTLDTAEEVRIPDAEEFAATVRVRGGPGVVVDRTAAASSGSANPQWGDDAPVPIVSRGIGRWVVPAVETPGTSTPAARTLVLENPGRRSVVALVSALARSGVHRVARVTVRPGAFATVTPRTVPLLVTADGSLVVTGDASLAGAPATALVPAIPQAPNSQA